MSGYWIPEDMQFVAEGHADHIGDMCRSSWRELGCTLYQGHSLGKHEAGTGNGYPVVAVWDDDVADGAT